MSKSNQSGPPKKKGIVLKILALAFGLIGAYFGSLFLSVVVEWTGIYFEWWNDSGAHHSYNNLQRELAWLNNDFKAMLSSPIEFAVLLSNITYAYAIQATGLEWLVMKLKQSAVYDYMLATIYVIQLNAVRLAVIILAMPAMILLGAYAAIDGLVERDLRTWGGGHETSYVYHHAKKWILPMIFTPIVLYLSSPWSIHPVFFVMAFAIPVSMAIWLTTMYFKKYL